MIDLIVLGLILAGLAAISRAPLPKHAAETPTPPAGAPDWRRFHKPTYLRRGIVLTDGRAHATRSDARRSDPVRSTPC